MSVSVTGVVPRGLPSIRTCEVGLDFTVSVPVPLPAAPPRPRAPPGGGVVVVGVPPVAVVAGFPVVDVDSRFEAYGQPKYAITASAATAAT